MNHKTIIVGASAYDKELITNMMAHNAIIFVDNLSALEDTDVVVEDYDIIDFKEEMIVRRGVKTIPIEALAPIGLDLPRQYINPNDTYNKQQQKLRNRYNQKRR